MHTANFGVRRRCLLAALVEVTLTLDFFSSNAMRLIPVQLRLSNRSTADPDSRHTLELAPSPSAVHFLKPRQLPNAPADRDRLDLCDVVDDLEVHSGALSQYFGGGGRRSIDGTKAQLAEPPFSASPRGRSSPGTALTPHFIFRAGGQRCHRAWAA